MSQQLTAEEHEERRLLQAIADDWLEAEIAYAERQRSLPRMETNIAVNFTLRGQQHTFRARIGTAPQKESI